MVKWKIKNASNSRKQPDKPAPGGFARLCELFGSSHYGTVLFILLTVGVYIVVRITAPSAARHAQMRFIENAGSDAPYRDAGTEVTYREPLSGSAYDTALRLRETGALGLAVSLSVFAREASTGNAPVNSFDVIHDVAARKLLPPGIQIDNGSFQSILSDLRFSYRSDPLSFEILALPKESGPALLLRFPLPPNESNSIMYFESQMPAQLPVPFSTIEQITGAGWKVRHWRGDALPLNETVIRELRENNEWLKSQNQGR